MLQPPIVVNMGNNQGGQHKRERTGDSQQRQRAWSGGGGNVPPLGEDGCPVQVRYFVGV